MYQKTPVYTHFDLLDLITYLFFLVKNHPEQRTVLSYIGWHVQFLYAGEFNGLYDGGVRPMP